MTKQNYIFKFDPLYEAISLHVLINGSMYMPMAISNSSSIIEKYVDVMKESNVKVQVINDYQTEQNVIILPPNSSINDANEKIKSIDNIYNYF